MLRYVYPANGHFTRPTCHACGSLGPMTTDMDSQDAAAVNDAFGRRHANCIPEAISRHEHHIVSVLARLVVTDDRDNDSAVEAAAWALRNLTWDGNGCELLEVNHVWS